MTHMCVCAGGLSCPAGWLGPPPPAGMSSLNSTRVSANMLTTSSSYCLNQPHACAFASFQPALGFGTQLQKISEKLGIATRPLPGLPVPRCPSLTDSHFAPGFLSLLLLLLLLTCTSSPCSPASLTPAHSSLASSPPHCRVWELLHR